MKFTSFEVCIFCYLLFIGSHKLIGSPLLDYQNYRGRLKYTQGINSIIFFLFFFFLFLFLHMCFLRRGKVILLQYYKNKSLRCFLSCIFKIFSFSPKGMVYNNIWHSISILTKLMFSEAVLYECIFNIH